MSYLFDKAVEAGIKVDLTKDNATYLKKQCEEMTAQLIAANARVFNNHDDREAAEALVERMGTKTRSKGIAHAQDSAYVGDAWRMVSDNCGIVRSMVSGERYHAYQLGLDTRHEAVIGNMFKLAVMVWSMLGEYSSPVQNEGRR